MNFHADGESMIFDLVVTVLVLVVIGFLCYLLTERVPMMAGFKDVIQLLVVIVLVLYVLGLLTGRAPLLRPGFLH